MVWLRCASSSLLSVAAACSCNQVTTFQKAFLFFLPYFVASPATDPACQGFYRIKKHFGLTVPFPMSRRLSWNNDIQNARYFTVVWFDWEEMVHTKIDICLICEFNGSLKESPPVKKSQ